MGHEHGSLITVVLLTPLCTLSLLAAASGGQQDSSTSEPVDVRVGLWRVPGSARGTPAVDDRRVYFLSQHHELVAIDRATGEVEWRASTGGNSGSTFGIRVVRVDGVVVGGDEVVVGVDVTTGARLWTYMAREAASAGVYLGDAAPGVVYAGSSSGRLHAIDTATGRPRWIAKVASDTTVYQPVLAGQLVVASFTTFGARPAGGVIAVDRMTGRIEWTRTLPPWRDDVAVSGVAGLPLIADDIVIAANQEGVVYGLSRSTGRVEWALPPPVPAGAVTPRPTYDFRPLARAGNLLVAGSLTGEVSAFDLTTRQLRWRAAPVASSVAFGLAADNDAVVVPYLSGELVALEAESGSVRWKAGGGSDGLVWTPALEGDVVYAAGSQAGFLALARHLSTEGQH